MGSKKHRSLHQSGLKMWQSEFSWQIGVCYKTSPFCKSNGLSRPGLCLATSMNGRVTGGPANDVLFPVSTPTTPLNTAHLGCENASSFSSMTGFERVQSPFQPQFLQLLNWGGRVSWIDYPMEEKTAKYALVPLSTRHGLLSLLQVLHIYLWLLPKYVSSAINKMQIHLGQVTLLKTVQK